MLVDDHLDSNEDRIQLLTHESARFANAMHVPLERIARMRDRIAENSARIRTAQKFVLSPQVVEACWEITSHGKGADVLSSRDYLFTPAQRTWIEWSEPQTHGVQSHRFGFMLEGLGEGNTALFVGDGICVHDMAFGAERTTGVPICYDFPGTGALIRGSRDSFLRGRSAQDLGIPEDMANLRAMLSLDLDRLGLFLGAALALINTPRVSQVVPHDLSKLNKARLKRDKPPLLSYKDVIIRPDSGWSTKSEARRETGEMRRHHVRTFLRLKQGKVELVRPHWRGNRDKGYVLHNHVVRMTDEEAGAWKGPPRIGERIIKPGDMDDLVDD